MPFLSLRDDSENDVALKLETREDQFTKLALWRFQEVTEWAAPCRTCYWVSVWLCENKEQQFFSLVNNESALQTWATSY